MALEQPRAYTRIPSWEPSREPRTSTAGLELQADPAASPGAWRLSLPHVCVATLAGVLFGYHIGVVNIPLDQIARDLGFTDNPFAKGFVVSTCLVGALLGCAFSGSLADKYGRRRTLQLSAVPMIVGASFSATASRSAPMLLGRFLVGIGLGIAGPDMSMYVSEISPTSVRGTFGSLCQTANCIGMLGAYVVSCRAPYVLKWWRSCFWISIIPAIGLAVGMQFCVESPRWLLKQSRRSEAERVFERLWGTFHVKGLERPDDTTEIRWSALFGVAYRQVVGVGSCLFALQQLSGINAIFYFSTTVFQNAGVTSDVAASILVGVVNLVASCTAAYFMDKQGRRSLLLWSFGGMTARSASPLYQVIGSVTAEAFAMGVQSVTNYLAISQPFHSYLSLTGTLVYGINVYVFMFAVGAGPVPGLLLPEIFSDHIRGKAMSVCMCVHWVMNFTVGLMFLPALQRVGVSGLYFFFTIACLCAVLFVRHNLPETKGKSLEELESMLLTKD